MSANDPQHVPKVTMHFEAWYEAMRAGLSPEELAVNDQFNDLCLKHAQNIVQHPMGPSILGVMMMTTPRAFYEDHVVCAMCSTVEAKDLSGDPMIDKHLKADVYDGDASKCPAVIMAKEITKFADDAGHPEWIDGDPLLDDNVPSAG